MTKTFSSQLPVLAVVLALCGNATLAAQPVLRDSEQSATKLCLEDNRPTADIIALCTAALKESGQDVATRSDVYSTLGDAHVDQDDFDAALDAFQSALALTPQSAVALADLGWYYYDTDDSDKAIEFFERSLQIRTRAGSLAGLAAALREQNGADPQVDQRAQDLLQGAIAISPDYRWARRELGWLHIDMDRFEEAYDAFRGALGVNERDSNALYGASRAQARLGNTEKAVEYVSSAIAENQNNRFYYGHRSELLRDLDRNRAAIADANRAIETWPDWDTGYDEKAKSEIALGLTAVALETYLAGVTAIPDSNFLRFNFADALSDLGHFDKALAHIDLAVALPGAESIDHSRRAYILFNLDRHTEMAEAAETAIALDEANEVGHYYRAVAHVVDKRLDEAEQAFDAAMSFGGSEEFVSAFVSLLVRRGHFLTALRVRAKYP